MKQQQQQRKVKFVWACILLATKPRGCCQEQQHNQQQQQYRGSIAGRGEGGGVAGHTRLAGLGSEPTAAAAAARICAPSISRHCVIMMPLTLLPSVHNMDSCPCLSVPAGE
jgi:hypothetical protein